MPVRHSFHGLEIGLRQVSGARALRVVHPGAQVIAFMKQLPDGSFETNRVNVGRDGLIPPM